MADNTVFGSRQTVSGEPGRVDEDFLIVGNRNTVDAGGGDDSILLGGNRNAVEGGAGDDVAFIFGNRNTVEGGNGNDIVIAAGSKNTLDGGSGNDSLYGRRGHDRLYGGTGNDQLVGVDSGNSGKGTFDILRGDAGADRYVLGQSGNLFYNDGVANNAGWSDLARIDSFSIAEGDVIQLTGSPSNYVLGNSPIAGTNGTGIFWDGSGADELIAVVADVTGLSLTDSYFTYV